MSETCSVLRTITAALCCFYQKNSVMRAKFSKDKNIMDGASEKLRRELEEELKQCGEEPRSHAWYHGAIPRQDHQRQLRPVCGPQRPWRETLVLISPSTGSAGVLHINFLTHKDS